MNIERIFGRYCFAIMEEFPLADDTLLEKSSDPEAFFADVFNGCNREHIKCILIPRHIEHLPDNLFLGCRELAMVAFEKGSRLKSIGKNGFTGCVNLRAIEIPAGVEVIHERCFSSNPTKNEPCNAKYPPCVRLSRVTFESGSRLKEIGKRAFQACSSLGEIEIPDTVETLGYMCFDGCKSLTRVTIPKSLKVIGRYAFMDCQLESIEFPDNIEKFPRDFKCDKLSHITFGENSKLKRLYIGATISLQSIIIPASVEHLRSEYFSDTFCYSVVFEKGSRLRSIGPNVFQRFISLQEIIIPASVEYLGQYCFNCCKTLTSVIFEEGSHLQNIGASAFMGCKRITEIRIPASVRIIGKYCFSDRFGLNLCKSLSRVIFEDGSCLEEIGTGAFAGCINLVEISLPNTNVRFTPAAFRNSGLERISFTRGVAGTVMDGFIMKGNEIMTSFDKISEITIPANVEVICDFCFETRRSISKLRFESGSRLRHIGKKAFYNCGLTSIEIPENLEVLGEKCFAGWDDLERVIFKSGSRMKCIGRKAFEYCYHLIEIECPATVEVLDDYCFAHAGCEETLIKFAAGSQLKRIGRNAFGSSGIREIVIPASVEEIGDLCFAGSEKTLPDPASRCQLEKITFEENSNLKRIGKSAFGGCQITEIEIPASVESLGSDLFVQEWGYDRYCLGMDVGYDARSVPSNISRVTFQRGSCIKRLDGVFRGCRDLSEIEIPASVEVLGSRCFGILWDYDGGYDCTTVYNCMSLTRVTFKAGSRLKEISEHAFEYCSALEEIEIPASVERLGHNCFGLAKNGSEWLRDEEYTKYLERYGMDMGYSNLRRVRFASGSCIKKIPEVFLWACPNVDEVELPGSVEEIDGSPFPCCNIQSVRFSGGNEVFKVVHDIHIVRIQSSSLIATIRDLTEVVIPDTVKEICDWCFWHRSVSSVKLPSGLKRVGNYVFSGCMLLKTIEIPSSVEEIGDNCFTDSALSRIIFANGSVLKRIGKKAFSGCPLSEVEIPGSVEDIGSMGFNRATTRFSHENRFFSITDRFVIRNDTMEIRWSTKDLDEIEIPANILSIGDYCFCSSGLRRVSFASGGVLRRIGKRTFANCEIEDITIPATVEEIGKKCFILCELSKVAFEKGSTLKFIGKKAFANCEIEDITIPATVEEIDDECFTQANVYNIAFEPGSCLKRIGIGAFRSNKRLDEFTIPAAVEEIGDHCFRDSSLCDLMFASGSVLKRVGRYAFNLCGLVEITIPASVEELDDDCFGNCVRLQIITFASPSVLVRIGKRAFQATSLTDAIQIPASVEVIDDYCFADCKDLIGVTFEDGSVIKRIGSHAFHKCRYLDNINLPAGVEVTDD